MAKTKQSFDFPQDLRDAQMELHRVQAELSAVYERLPWSAEPLPGWSHTKENGRSFAGGRPDSAGYTDEEKAQVEGLRARRLELVGVVFAHPYWAGCDNAVAARSALKHAHEQAPDESEA